MEALPDDLVLDGETSWLRLRIARYQFPDISGDMWDANWLMIEGQACLDGRTWSFLDPCLTTFEAADLARWLEEVAEDRASQPDCYFTEPNLEFHTAAERLRVVLSQECGPPWQDRGPEPPEYGFDVPIGPNLLTAARRWRRQLEHFPSRGPVPRT